MQCFPHSMDLHLHVWDGFLLVFPDTLTALSSFWSLFSTILEIDASTWYSSVANKWHYEWGSGQTSGFATSDTHLWAISFDEKGHRLSGRDCKLFVQILQGLPIRFCPTAWDRCSLWRSWNPSSYRDLVLRTSLALTSFEWGLWALQESCKALLAPHLPDGVAMSLKTNIFLLSCDTVQSSIVSRCKQGPTSW